MDLTPQERDRLLLATAADLARRRRARGLLLNVPETIALIADTAAEAARDGLRLAEAIAAGQATLRADEVLPGVADIVTRVTVEAVFDDGTRLIVVPNPLGPSPRNPRGPGSILLDNEDQAFGVPTAVAEVVVSNTSEVPISVTSHLHFFEANPRLRFDRSKAYGMRLAVAAGVAVRFDPGASVQVPLTPFGGERVAIGFSGLVDGPLDAPGAREAALARAAATGYLGAEASE